MFVFNHVNHYWFLALSDIPICYIHNIIHKNMQLLVSITPCRNHYYDFEKGDGSLGSLRRVAKVRKIGAPIDLRRIYFILSSKRGNVQEKY